MPVTIAEILDVEVDRLNNRKIAIDNAEEERKRIVRFNKSGTERKQAYNNLYLVIVIVLFILVCIKLLYQFDFIPDTLLDILMIVVISGGLIYCMMLYADILNRSNMDFSQIEFEKVAPKTQDQKDKEELDRIKSGDLINNSSTGKCVGQECCPADSTYNPTFKICVPNVVPHGVVPIKVGNTELQYGTNAKFTVVATSTYTTAQIIADLTDPTKYKYCRKTNGTYAWLPITSSNKMMKDDKTALSDVVATDPNYVIATRPVYVPETMSTNPVKTEEAFTSAATTIQPFSEKPRFATYV
jgi:hypothetical protein